MVTKYHYRGYVIEYIPHREDYKIYDPKYPAQTVAYVDSIVEAMDGIDEQGIYNKEVTHNDIQRHRRN